MHAFFGIPEHSLHILIKLAELQW
uniref:Uncharacterized protein n=1 Tax=Arundo donax TaxID=35708 RepID=A0A0A9F705_ARUDO